MKLTLLKELIAAVQRYSSCSEKITQPIFLNNLFDLDISYKVAGEVILLKNTIELRRNMREKCNQREFESKIREVIVDKWEIKDKYFDEELKKLVEDTRFLTHAEKKALLRNSSVEYKVRRLLHIGLSDRKIYFAPYKTEESKFRGRDADISKIRDILCDEHNEQKICYLYSVNGIGKTALSKYM